MGSGAWQVGAGYILRNGGARISEDCGAELLICSLLYLQLLNREEAVGNSGPHIICLFIDIYISLNFNAHSLFSFNSA